MIDQGLSSSEILWFYLAKWSWKIRNSRGYSC